MLLAQAGLRVMIYAVVFSLFAAFLTVVAAGVGGWAWLLLWPAFSFALVAAGYVGLGPRVFGKRDDGLLGWPALVVLLPYLALSFAGWHLLRRFSREPCCHEVTPGVWLGRRPLRHEVPAGVLLIVDLTAEFFPARGVRAGREYFTLPTLDASAPDEARLRALVARLAEYPHPVYIHCAAGYGRSALVAAAVLLSRGLAQDEREAEELLRRVRPGVRITRPQKRLLHRLVATPNVGQVS